MSRVRASLFVTIIAVIIAAFMAPVAPAEAQTPAYFYFTEVLSQTCTPGEYPQFHFFYGESQGVVVNHIWTLTNTTKGTSTGPYTMSGFTGPEDVEVAGNHVDLVPVPAGTDPSDTLVQRVEVVDAETQTVYDVAEISWSCAGPAAGCDVAMPISSKAVVGTFTQTTPTYWSPGNLTNPVVSIDAGKTAWVLGQDASEQYYEIIWVCDLLWVPVNTIGPNYDAVWNGKPLPTGTVK